MKNLKKKKDSPLVFEYCLYEYEYEYEYIAAQDGTDYLHIPFTTTMCNFMII